MTPRKTLMAQLAEREQQVAAAHTKVAEIEEQARQASAEAERLREALVEAFAADDKAEAEKLTRAVDKAQLHAAEPWRERVDGSKRAANRLQAEVDAWRAEHVRELLDEVSPSAHAAVEAVRTAIAALEEARQGWHQTADRVSALIRGSIDPKAMPSFDRVDSAVREFRRDVGPIEPPLPRWQSVSIPAVDDPDPAVRGPVRQAVKDKAGQR